MIPLEATFGKCHQPEFMQIQLVKFSMASKTNCFIRIDDQKPNQPKESSGIEVDKLSPIVPRMKPSF
jgi:hypothetical protein